MLWDQEKRQLDKTKARNLCLFGDLPWDEEERRTADAHSILLVRSNSWPSFKVTSLKRLRDGQASRSHAGLLQLESHSPVKNTTMGVALFPVVTRQVCSWSELCQLDVHSTGDFSLSPYLERRTDPHREDIKLGHDLL